MSPAVATAGIDGASGAMSGGAVAEATAAPVGSGLAGAAVGEVLDDGQSFAKDRGERQRPQREYEKHQWSKPNVRRAAKSIEEGESIVRVETRAQAEELRRKLYPDCKDTTGLTGKQVREMRGNKNGTYHWDDQIGEDGLVQGHGPENPHAADPHLQIHTEDRRLIRIMFSQ